MPERHAQAVLRKAPSRSVNGSVRWLHYFPHPKCGAEALDAFGLPVHDHWSAYARYQCLHAFCNAHHLRELTAIAETIPSQQWATDMSALLCEAYAQVNAARAQGLSMLPAGALERLQDRYDALLTAAEVTNPRRPRRPGTRGRVKQSPAYNLIAPLRQHRDEVFRFITDVLPPAPRHFFREHGVRRNKIYRLQPQPHQVNT